MGAGQGHRRSAIPLADMQHVAAQPLAVRIPLAGNLLGRRQDGLDLAQVDEDRPGVLALLDHAGHDISLAARVLPEGQFVLGVTEPLQNHLARRGRRDPAEPARRVVILPQHRAVLGGLRAPDGDVPAAAVHLDPGRGSHPPTAVIRDQQRVLDGLDGQVHRDVLLALQAAQDAQVNVHPAPPRRRTSRRPPPRPPCCRIPPAPCRARGPGSRTRAARHRSPASPRPPPPLPGAPRPAPAATPRPCTDVTGLVDSEARTSLPVARRQCLGSVSGRSTPGEETSRVWAAWPITPEASSSADTDRLSSAISSRPGLLSASTTTRSSQRRPAAVIRTDSRSMPAAMTTGSSTVVRRSASAGLPPSGRSGAIWLAGRLAD